MAYNRFNPFPGTIFNHPGNNQRNYQEGLVIDYDQQYNPPKELYMGILLGEAEGKEQHCFENVKLFDLIGSGIWMDWLDFQGMNSFSPFENCAKEAWLESVLLIQCIDCKSLAFKKWSVCCCDNYQIASSNYFSYNFFHSFSIDCRFVRNWFFFSIRIILHDTSINNNIHIRV